METFQIQEELVSKGKSFAASETREGGLKALSLFNSILQHGKDTTGEIHYLQGLIAAGLSENNQTDALYFVAESSLNEGIENFPESPYTKEMMKTLSILYFKKEKYPQSSEVFQKLLEKFPEEKGDSLFWLALMESDLKKKEALFTEVYEKHPTSTYADEAYIRKYSLEEYIQENPVAVNHLKSFHKLFPNSPYNILSYYLLGFYDKSVQAFNAFEEVPAYFKNIKERALIGQVKSLYHENRIEEAIAILEKMNTDESLLWLSKGYILQNNEMMAEKILTEMHNKFQTAKLTRGYYLAEMWRERGLLSLRQEDYTTALKHFLSAEDAAKGNIYNTDELLSLWILQSECYKKMNEMENAMLALSRVANYNDVSSLRIKAMYLRAEIYELQGRFELAKKQWEATSLKGGEWALKSQQKLEKNYVY